MQKNQNVDSKEYFFFSIFCFHKLRYNFFEINEMSTTNKENKKKKQSCAALFFLATVIVTAAAVVITIQEGKRIKVENELLAYEVW